VSCDVCGGLGMLILEWTDAPSDFAVCLCQAGQVYRTATNNRAKTVPLWRVWCAREQVDPSRVFLLEDIYSPSELDAVGLSVHPVPLNRMEALLASGRKARL
jgi:hypothetical protein